MEKFNLIQPRQLRLLSHLQSDDEFERVKLMKVHRLGRLVICLQEHRSLSIPNTSVKLNAKLLQISLWDIEASNCLGKATVHDIFHKIRHPVASNDSEVAYLESLSARLNAFEKSLDAKANKVKPIAVTSNVFETIGESITQLEFMDLASVTNSSSFINDKSLQNMCDFPFHSQYMICITCSNGLLFFDFESGSSSFLDIKRSPTFVSALQPNVLAIGCNDGMIRIYDCVSSQVVKTLEAHSKEIVFLSTFQQLGIPWSLPKESSVAFLSIGNDGIVFLWIGDVVGNIITFEKPKARLQGIFGSKNNTLLPFVEGSVSYDNDLHCLTIVSGDHVVHTFDFQQLPSLLVSNVSAIVSIPIHESCKIATSAQSGQATLSIASKFSCIVAASDPMYPRSFVMAAQGSDSCYIVQRTNTSTMLILEEFLIANAKIISLTSLTNQRVLIATSLGLMIFHVGKKFTALVGNHISWNRNILVYDAIEASLRLVALSLKTSQKLSIDMTSQAPNIRFAKNIYNLGISRPSFHVAPSGTYCILHWMDSFKFIVLSMKQGSPKLIDHGYAAHIGWIGLSDVLLLVTPTMCSIEGVKNKKVEVIHPCTLMTKIFRGNNSKSPRLRFSDTGSLSPNDIETMFSGLYLSICTNKITRLYGIEINSTEDEILLYQMIESDLPLVSKVSWNYLNGNCAFLVNQSLSIVCIEPLVCTTIQATSKFITSLQLEILIIFTLAAKRGNKRNDLEIKSKFVLATRLITQLDRETTLQLVDMRFDDSCGMDALFLSGFVSCHMISFATSSCISQFNKIEVAYAGIAENCCIVLMSRFVTCIIYI